MKRAALYLRVSTVGQVRRAFSDEGYSIETQRERCHRKARELEVEVADEYIDYGDSARYADRRQFQALLERVRQQGDLDYVIVYNVARFARKMEDDVVIAAELERLGVRLVSATEHFDDTPFGKFMRRLLGAQAELYSENLSFEAKRGLHQKARLGGTPGPAPLGYLNVHKQVDGCWIATVDPDPDRAHHVRWAFVAYATGGYTLDTLHAALKRRGLVTRKTRKYAATPVSRAHLARILANPYYAGIVRYGGVEYEGRHEPLIDKDSFSRVQAVLAAHSNSKEKDRKHHHYLKGSLACALCGSRLTFVRATGNGGTYSYFGCIGRIKRTGCRLPYLSAEGLEEKVAPQCADVRVKQLGVTDKGQWVAHIEDVRRALDEAISGMRKYKAAEVSRQRRRIAAIKTQQEKLLDAFLDDALPRELLREKQTTLTDSLAEAERALRLAEQDGVALGRVLNEVLDLVTHLETTYELVDPQTRRQLNQSFFEWFKVGVDGITEARLDHGLRELTALDTPRRLRAEARQLAVSGLGSNKTLLAVRAGFEPATFGLSARAYDRADTGLLATPTVRLRAESAVQFAPQR